MQADNGVNKLQSEMKSNGDVTVLPNSEDGNVLFNIIDDDGRISKMQTAYATKKTVAQGMMDLALITANANQLRYLIQYQTESATFYLTFTLIIISIVLQILVGLCLIYKGRLNVKGEERLIQAEKVNNFVVVGIFFVTIINVFNAAFFITPTPKGNA